MEVDSLLEPLHSVEFMGTEKEKKLCSPKFGRYHALTLAERVLVIQEFDKRHKSANQIAKEFGCSKTQILFIIKNRHIYEREWKLNCNSSRIRRSISPHTLAIGIIVFEYVWRLRHYPISVNDENLKSIGREIANMMKYQKFKSSKRWLDRFKSAFRLENSILLTSSIVHDGQKKKSLKIKDVFEDIKKELESCDVSLMDLNEGNLLSLKSIRSKKLNDSLCLLAKKGLPHFSKKPIKLLNIKIKEESENVVELCSDNETENSDSNSTDFSRDNKDLSYQSLSDNTIIKLYKNEDNKKKSLENLSASPKPSTSKAAINEDNIENEIDDEIKNYNDAIRCLKIIEDFVTIKNDSRAIRLTDRLGNYLKSKISDN